jgi:hypothetical protein
MPLTFRSLNHGNVAFGFFNIKSDMLLLENSFFFSTSFCYHLSRLAEKSDIKPAIDLLPAYIIEKSSDIGDLMGAIHGFHFTGFIGDVYRQFPFPGNPHFFKQNPTCVRTQDIMKQLISRYARPDDIPFIASADGHEIIIGDYRFSRSAFHQLVEYVWVGGYPRWKDDIRPHHVRSIKAVLLKSQRNLFAGLSLNE